MQFELTREFLEHLQEAISSNSEETVLENVQELHPADISNVLEEVSEEEAKYILKVLSLETQADVISEFDDDDRPRFVKRVFSPKRMAQLLQHVDSDDAADILNEQSAQFREESLAAVEDREHAKDLEDLLRFDEDTAGGLMAKELISVNINWNVQRCIEEIRAQRDEVEKIYTTYVIDDDGKLQGILSLKKLLLASDSVRVEDLFEKNVVSVRTYDVEEDVVSILQKYDLNSLPVVNTSNKIV
jgi:magnesium transporter